jgi:diacylglycerol kinase family enzyme
VGNGRCAGGGFHLNPDADPFDGTFDVCIAGAHSRRQVLRFIPRGLRGTHVSLPGVHCLRETRLRIASSEPLHAHADGELLSERLTWAELEILPGILPLIC